MRQPGHRSPRIAVEQVVPIARFDVPLPVPAPIAVRAAAASAAFRTGPTVVASVMSAEEPRKPSHVPRETTPGSNDFSNNAM